MDYTSIQGAQEDERLALQTIYQDLLVWDNTDCSGTYGALSVIPSLDTSIAISIPGSTNNTKSSTMPITHFPPTITIPSHRIIHSSRNLNISRGSVYGVHHASRFTESTGNTRNATPEHELCENIRCTYQTFGPEPLPQQAPQPKLPAVPPGETVALSSIQRAMFKQDSINDKVPVHPAMIHCHDTMTYGISNP
ncbi:hypothetical protein SeLEV6574_g08202 [Synchytrium endobioticum]|uniref:Uncharacterized protein n=1 Tax=Synchytrium endobioticum TaxID=286115 RepID=A0A507C6R3_9FUNG|nr:hypothetical protein SeLEV6574_g08202 [Synchytrium endobioticum]